MARRIEVFASAPGAGSLADRTTGISLNGSGGGHVGVQTPARANLDFSTPAPAASAVAKHFKVRAFFTPIKHRQSREMDLNACRRSFGLKTHFGAEG